MEKYGFIYEWYDLKTDRKYIGSHWGYVDDGYICSSKWMRNAYKRRPKDFKRRIIITQIHCKKELLKTEDRILRKIKKEDLGKKYYNLKNNAQGIHDKPHNEETKRKIGDAQIGSKNHMFGKLHTEESRKKISLAGTGRVLSQITRQKISDTRKSRIKSGQLIISGHKHTEESINKIKEKRSIQIFSKESKNKMSNSAKGRRWYKCEKTGKRIFYRESVI